MVDRIETRSLSYWLDPRLQALASSPYSQHPGRLSGSITSRYPSRGNRQRQERELMTQEIFLRALNIDRNRRRSRRYHIEATARRTVERNFEILSQLYSKQVPASRRARERSAPGSFPRGEKDGERRIRVSSAYHRTFETKQDSSDPDERSSRPSVSIEESHACEVNVCYAPNASTSVSKPKRDEVIVMQQHSNGDNLVIYRGSLAKGESFSFKPQRRPSSPLALAYYVKGSLEIVVQTCCELRYGQESRNSQDHDEFLVESVQKANPCERCRRKQADRLPQDNESNTSADHVATEYFPAVHHSHASIKQRSSAVEKTNQPKKISKFKKHTTAVVPLVDGKDQEKQVPASPKSKKPVNTDQTPQAQANSVDFGPLESMMSNPAEPATARLDSPDPTEKKKKKPVTKDQAPKHPVAVPTESDTPPSTDLGSVLQMFLQQMVAQQQNGSDQSETSNTLRDRKRVENFVYVLDSEVSISAEEQEQLHGIINFGVSFDGLNDQQCIDFVTQVTMEQVVLILSEDSRTNLNERISDASQICLTYIVDPTDDSKHGSENHLNMTSVCKQLEKDLPVLVGSLMNIVSVATDGEGDGNFPNAQVLQEILLETDDKANLKKDMIDFCRDEYADNAVQLKLIDQFEKQFQPQDAVHWYGQQKAFVFKMLSRAFRTLEPDILFKLRFFIQHLHQQLKSNSSSSSLTVYRTLPISKEKFEQLQNRQGGFLSFNEFLRVSKTAETMKGSSKKPKVKLVQFHMELGSTIPRAQMEANANELLLTAGVVFRISKVESIDQEISIVKLSSSDDIWKAAQPITKALREATRAPQPLIRVAKLMKHTSNMNYIEYFCLILMNDPNSKSSEAANLTAGGLFHTLGTFYYEKAEYDRALEQLQRSLEVYLRVLPPDDIKLSPTYNNMGSIFHKQDLNQKALEFHRKAYDIQSKSKNPDLDSVASYAGNIASVLLKLGRIEEGISYLERDLTIQQRLHPDNDHIPLAAKYHNLAGAQFRLQKFDDALENYQKCLDLELRLHPSNHPTVAVTYFNMATAFEGLGRLEEAKQTIDKAIERLLMTRNEDDDEIQMYKQFKTRIEQKLWVKTLFDTT